MSDKIKEWDTYFGTHCHLPAGAIRDLFERIEKLEASIADTNVVIAQVSVENERLRAVLRFAYEPGCDCEACYEIQKALAAVEESEVPDHSELLRAAFGESDDE